MRCGGQSGPIGLKRSPLSHPWLPLYLLLLLAATLFPFRPTGCAAPPWESGFDGKELLRNALLFLPLGLVLPGRIGVAAGVALLGSGALEGVQGFLGRQPSLLDVLGNAIGAALGSVVAGRAAGPSVHGIRPGPARAALCAAAIVVLAAAVASPERRARLDFSNWERFPLLVGNEATGDRPWNGGLAELAIYDRAHRDQRGDDPPPAWEDGGPVLWMRLEAPAALRLDGPAGPRELPLPRPAWPVSAAEVRGAAPPWRLPRPLADHLFERLRATARLSVYARIRPQQPGFEGLARIVSLSSDPLHRDFTLGQQGRDLRFRVRTPATGPNGATPEAVTHGAPLVAREHRVLASFDGEVSRILVDGRCEGAALVAVERAPLLLGRMLGATVVGCTALAALAAAALAGPGRSPWLVASLHVAGGATAWLVLGWAGTWTHVSGFGGAAAALGVAALGAAAPLSARIRRRHP